MNNYIRISDLKCPSKSLDCALKDLFAKYNKPVVITSSFDDVTSVYTLTVNGVSQEIPMPDNQTLSISPDNKSILISDGNSIDLSALVKQLETLTVLAYDPATKKVSYTDEDEVVTELDLSELAKDTFIETVTYDPTASALTLTYNDAAIPDILVDLKDLKQVVTEDSDTVEFSGTGETATPLTASVKIDPVVENLLTATTDGLLVDPAALKALASVELVDAFSNETLGFIYP
jgi:hypothetical protein